MNNFVTITNKIKVVLSQTIEGKVYDKDVANALGIKPMTFASMKRRSAIPHKAILDYCADNNINANDLLFGKPVNNTLHAPVILKEPITIKYFDELQASAGDDVDGL